jgi:hypothetical protein
MKSGDICNHCGTEMEAEFVDIGIGWQQVTESICPNQCDYIEYLLSETTQNEILKEGDF